MGWPYSLPFWRSSSARRFRVAVVYTTPEGLLGVFTSTAATLGLSMASKASN